MTLSLPSKDHQAFSRVSQLKPLKNHNDLLIQSQILQIGSASLETHIGSVLVLTDDYKVLYTTASLQHKLEELTEPGEDSTVVTQEIIHICQVLKQCREHFPDQNWAIEFDIVTRNASVLHIRSRWLKLEGFDKPCILLIVEDRQQLIQDMVRDEAEDWGLTAREQEVWLLHQDGYTYRQIAEKLYITINTVKKHMRSVHGKRKSQLDPETEERDKRPSKVLRSLAGCRAMRA